MTVGIIGGGIMGITLGYLLSRRGIPVEIFEASPVLGGLAGPLTLPDGAQVDRFYHAILSSDSHLRQLCTELGIADQLRFHETKMAFYYQNDLHSMNNIIEFLRFPPLGWLDRFRLGLTVLYAQFVRDWHSLERIGVEKWLVGLSGRTTFDNIWRPMLKAKFDGGFENTPATYIWARLVRVKSTRGGASQKEEAGYLIGGYATLMKAMAQALEAAGSRIHLRAPAQEIVIEQGRAVGIRIAGEVQRFEAVVATTQAPVFQRLIPGAPRDYHNFLEKTQYLGIVCPLLVLDRPLTDYWTVNITDDSIPFTGVIETTSYIDPAHVGGHHLIYLPKYTAPGSHWQGLSDDDIRDIWLQNLERMFPAFKREWVRHFPVHREKYVEPLHGLNETHLIPSIETPVKDLYLATTAQIYPALTNGESVTRHARAAAEAVAARLAAPLPAQRPALEAAPEKLPA
jgi:protoporphyrinogen oxidase